MSLVYTTSYFKHIKKLVNQKINKTNKFHKTNNNQVQTFYKKIFFKVLVKLVYF